MALDEPPPGWRLANPQAIKPFAAALLAGQSVRLEGAAPWLAESRLPLAEAAEIAIVPNTGAEVIAGSTRMKAGLAQKMILHLLSTTVMVRLGYVKGNLMTHLVPSSQKLRERAIGILESTTQLNKDQAARLLDESGGSVADALASLQRRDAG